MPDSLDDALLLKLTFALLVATFDSIVSKFTACVTVICPTLFASAVG